MFQFLCRPSVHVRSKAQVIQCLDDDFDPRIYLGRTSISREILFDYFVEVWTRIRDFKSTLKFLAYGPEFGESFASQLGQY